MPSDNNTEYAVDIKNLVKVYPKHEKTPPKTALDDVNLQIPKGCIFGLLGPNGAGKSTLINILAGLASKTSGTVSIWGHDITKEPRSSKFAIGVVLQEIVLEVFFSVREILDMQAGLYGIPKKERKTEELLEIVGLTKQADSSMRSLSGGMQRRLMIAKALSHNPKVLVLDEPTAGVDIELRQSLWEYVKKLNKAGTTILLTTHYLYEAEELCDYIAVINHGKIIANNKKTDLLGSRKRITIELKDPIEELNSEMLSLGWQRLSPYVIEASYNPQELSVEVLLKTVMDNGYTIKDVSAQPITLEEIFLRLIH
ncbi:MAG: ABC transporter ATP-binding protein [Alphaproteobacteria bacterium]|nr:ABC transporter ATP-binding protein [Alphaproteobacteria bacterium]MCL2504732.1 ABC transporter ATP-binding protein [Alphaproteobacteria bacterium]